MSRRAGDPVTDRRAFVLILVLVVVVLLALSAYSFVELMLTEKAATDFHGRRIKSRLFAESGIAFVKSTLVRRQLRYAETVNVQDDTESFRESLIGHNGQGRFTVFAPSDSATVNYGVLDLSARINLNMLATSDADSARHALMQLPKMSVAVADAILDWIDVDDNPRQYGAESRYYEGQGFGHPCRNRPIASIDELLLVRGVTPILLYGVDRNHNGRIDPYERDRTKSGLRVDDTDRAGWAQWMTAVSGERNVRRDGRPRINLNHSTLTDLFDDVAAEFGTETAKFIMAYRMYGPFPACADIRPQTSSANQDQPTKLLPHQGADQNVRATEERAGMILNSGPRYSIRSIYDLVGIQVGYVDESGSLLTSPWSIDRGELGESFFTFEDAVGVTSETFIPGRINLFQADMPVLCAIPGFTADVASRILAQRKAWSMVADEDRQSIGQFLQNGIVDLNTLRRVAPFVTSRGDVVVGQVIGHFAGRNPPYCRLEFIIKMSQQGPRIIRYRDLSEFGPGWPTEASD